MPDVARSGGALISYANNLYYLGGNDGTNYLSDVQFASIGYKTGTISQSGATITGSGTTFTAAMVGSTIQYVSDGSTATITAYTSATSIDVDVSKTVAGGETFMIDDGSVGNWTFSTSLPQYVSDADGFASNGFMYLFGGRSAASTCTNNTYVSPISANTTIATGNNPTGVGEWYQTNVEYTGDRYSSAVAHADGKFYISGGGCGTELTTNEHYYGTLRSQPQLARYSYYIDADTDVFPNAWLLNGLDNNIGARWQFGYRSSASAPNTVFHESYDAGTDGVQVNGLNDGSPNSEYSNCYNNNGTGTASHLYTDTFSVTPDLSVEFDVSGGTGSTACDIEFSSPVSTSNTRFDRFYIDIPSNPPSSTVIYSVEDDAGGDMVAELQFRSDGTLHLRDQYTSEDNVTVGTGTHRIEVGIVNDQMTVRVFSGANLHSETPSDSDVINLDNGPNVYDEVNFGILTSVNSWGFYLDEHKASQSDWVGSAFPTWGQNTDFGDVTLGNVEDYTPLDGSGSDTSFARFYYVTIGIDASQTFGYPDDVTRGPTIDDFTLFFTSDPNKRLRHGKTFIQGVQQPLNTPPPGY